MIQMLALLLLPFQWAGQRPRSPPCSPSMDTTSAAASSVIPESTALWKSMRGSRKESEWESGRWLPGLPDRVGANCEWRLLPVFTVADSVDSALPPESTMLSLRQPVECARGAFDDKMEARAGSHEIDSCVVEGSDATLLRILDGAIGSCHRLMRRSDGNRISRGGCPELKAAST
jgi:hypothetical protein